MPGGNKRLLTAGLVKYLWPFFLPPGIKGLNFPCFFLDHHPKASSIVDGKSITYITADERSHPSKVRKVNSYVFGWIYKVNSFEYCNDAFVLYLPDMCHGKVKEN